MPLISRLDVAEKSITEFVNISMETPKTKKQRRKKA